MHACSVRAIRADPSSANAAASLRDDIEELYDANFGEHFRRLRREEEAAATASRLREGRGRGGSEKASGHSDEEDNKVGVGRDDSIHDDAGSGRGSRSNIGPPSTAAGGLPSKSTGTATGTGTGTGATAAKRAAGPSAGPGARSGGVGVQPLLASELAMPTTYRHAAKKQPGRNGVDAAILSNLEREVALLADQSQRQQQQQEEREQSGGVGVGRGGGGNEGESEDEDEEHRRQKSLSFVQRVRRSLSFQQSSSSSSSSSSSKKKKKKQQASEKLNTKQDDHHDKR
jgi:hypothetical protein